MRPRILTLLIAVSLVSSAIALQGCSRKATKPTPKADLEIMDEGLDGPQSISSSGGKLDEITEEEPGASSPSRSTASSGGGASAHTASKASAPSRSLEDPTQILRIAAGEISRELADEQEDFFLKRADSTEARYRPEGQLLIPTKSLDRMRKMLSSKYPVKLEVHPESFEVNLPKNTSVSASSGFTEVTIAGKPVEGVLDRSDTSSDLTATLKARFHYSLDAGEGSKQSSDFAVNRTIRYRLSPKGEWRRIGVDEKAASGASR
ncbi:MAG: hypothetical protein GHCLOJNM_04171 [bacterium]|nr:hypothetical protein [bacterium]